MSITSIIVAKSLRDWPSGTSCKYIKIETNGAWPLVDCKVINWYWIVWHPASISLYTSFSTNLLNCSSFTWISLSVSSSFNLEEIFLRLSSTNGTRCERVNVWPPYWLEATCATIWDVTVQAVIKECGRSIFVPLIQVPFQSISSRLIKSQLCICCAK